MVAVSICGFTFLIPISQGKELNIDNIFKQFLALLFNTVSPAIVSSFWFVFNLIAKVFSQSEFLSLKSQDEESTKQKINIIAFDKTGGFTEDYMKVYGFRPVVLEDKEVYSFGAFSKELTSDINESYNYYKEKRKIEGLKDKNKELKQMYVECLATCHSLQKDHNELVGDSIDIKMFQASQWDLYENEGNNDNNALISAFVRPFKEMELSRKLEKVEDIDEEDMIIKQHYEIGIIKRFEFTAELKRMSVIAKDVNDPYSKIFCKGAGMAIKSLCRPDTIPSNYDEIFDKYTSKGLNVLGLAAKMMKMSYTQAQDINQESIEKNMIFLGFLVFQRKLSRKTAQEQEEDLKKNCRTVLLTQDDIIDTIKVGKESMLIRRESKVYTCDLINSDTDEKEKKLIWFSVIDSFRSRANSRKKSEWNEKLKGHRKRADSINIDDININNFKEDDKDTNTTDNSSNDDINQYLPIEGKLNETYYIAITGSIFESLSKLNHLWNETKEQKYQIFSIIFNLMLRYCYIYSQMNNDNKELLILSLRKQKYDVMLFKEDIKSPDIIQDKETNENNYYGFISKYFSKEIFQELSVLIISYMMIFTLFYYLFTCGITYIKNHMKDIKYIGLCLILLVLPIVYCFFGLTSYSLNFNTKRLIEQTPHHILVILLLSFIIVLQCLITICFHYCLYYLFISYSLWNQYSHCSIDNFISHLWNEYLLSLILNLQLFICGFPYISPLLSFNNKDKSSASNNQIGLSLKVAMSYLVSLLSVMYIKKRIFVQLLSLTAFFKLSLVNVSCTCLITKLMTTLTFA